MHSLFISIKNLVTIPKIVTDNAVFRLHYRFTVAVLLAGVILGTSQLFGSKSMECINNDDFPDDLVAMYCWIHSTFSVPSSWNKTVGEEVPYPGVGKHVKGQDRVYHKYYQWVYVVLFLQAVFFYMPRYIWRTFECKRIHKLVLGLNVPILEEQEKKKNRKLLVGYLYTHFGYHRLYVIPYVICEIFNLVNIIVQMILMDRFLGGEFTTFGTQVLQFTAAEDQEFRYDPMVRIFPRMAKCTIHRFGPSGGVTRHDAFCLLPLNIINEKIYIFLWFWFVILATVTALALVYRALSIMFPGLRRKLLMSRARLTDQDDIITVANKAHFGDWFILYLLCKNLDPVHYRDIIKKLAKKFKPNKDSKPLLKKKEKSLD